MNTVTSLEIWMVKKSKKWYCLNKWLWEKRQLTMNNYVSLLCSANVSKPICKTMVCIVNCSLYCFLFQSSHTDLAYGTACQVDNSTLECVSGAICMNTVVPPTLPDLQCVCQASYYLINLEGNMTCMPGEIYLSASVWDITSLTIEVLFDWLYLIFSGYWSETWSKISGSPCKILS